MGLFDGLVAYFDFRNWDLSNLVTGEKATNNGATLTTDHLGYENCAYRFDSSTDKIIAPWPTNYSSYSWLTYNFLVSHNNWDNWERNAICVADTDNDNRFIFEKSTKNTLYVKNLNWGVEDWIAYDVSSLEDWKVYMLTWIQEGNWEWSVIKLYINWNLVDSVTTNNWLQNYNTLQIWNHPRFDEWWKGNIYLWMIYNRALSDSEVKLLYKLLIH